MLVTTASTGCRCRKLASDSSASTTMNSPAPRRALDPAAFSLPPITKVGSSPPSASTLATRLVVVVLPWVPAIAMPCFRRISSASISARGTTGMRLARAAATSGLSPFTAVDTTTASAPSMLPLSCLTMIFAPRLARRRVAAFSARSEPLTSKPRFTRTSAMPLMPEPPIPTKWMRLSLCFMRPAPRNGRRRRAPPRVFPALLLFRPSPEGSCDRAIG